MQCDTNITFFNINYFNIYRLPPQVYLRPSRGSADHSLGNVEIEHYFGFVFLLPNDILIVQIIKYSITIDYYLDMVCVL